MQKVVEFKKRGFWSNRLDVIQLNEKIATYVEDGWRVMQIAPLTNFLGVPVGYSLLLEMYIPAR